MKSLSSVEQKVDVRDTMCGMKTGKIDINPPHRAEKCTLSHLVSVCLRKDLRSESYLKASEFLLGLVRKLGNKDWKFFMENEKTVKNSKSLLFHTFGKKILSRLLWSKIQTYIRKFFCTPRPPSSPKKMQEFFFKASKQSLLSK